MDLETLRYPVGKFDAAMSFTQPRARPPSIVAGACRPSCAPPSAAWTIRQLETPYRPEGWTVRQVVHHIADSHMNGLTRTKLALTENTPAIKPYDENAWATLGDMRLPIDVSLGIIDGIHARWAAVFRSMSDEHNSPGRWCTPSGA